MMAGLRIWLLSILSACLLCAAAEALMPPGAVKRVGKLVCALALLCAVLSPVPGLDLAEGQRWLEDYFAGLEAREEELGAQVSGEMKSIIERSCAAYIVDKAAELGLTCAARVECRAAEDGLYVPDRAEITGPLSPEEERSLARLVEADLGIPAERQAYHREEGSP